MQDFTNRELTHEINKLWDSGQILRALMGLEPGLFPLSIDAQVPSSDPNALDAWRAEIESQCRCSTGSGYRIEYATDDMRLPQRLVFEHASDAAAFIGQQAALGQFARAARAVRRRFPALQGWIERHPLRLLSVREDEWPLLLDLVQQCLKQRPQPPALPRDAALNEAGRAIIERHRPLLAELLRQAPPQAAPQVRISSSARRR